MARIGGAFPFPTAQVAEGGGTVVLPSGGVFYPPSGQYLFATGGNTVVQWFDPINQCWRVLFGPGQFGYLSADGYNYRLINLSGVVIGAAITNGGAGGTNGIGATATGASVTFAAPAAGGALATATGYVIIGGSVQAPTIAAGGSGFLVPPTIMIDPPPPGGIQAVATATISAAGVITAITMQNVGAGYAANPNFWIAPQFGSYPGGAAGSFAAGANPAPGLVFPGNALPGNQNTGAAGAQLVPLALTGSGAVTGIVMVTNGNGYTGTTIPAVTITGTGLVGATGTAVMSLTLLSVTLGSGGTGYGAGSPPNWISSDGLVSGAQNNTVLAPSPARGVTTVTGGAVATFVVEDGGFGLQKVPTIAVVNTSAVATGQATGTAVVGGAADTSILQPRVQ